MGNCLLLREWTMQKTPHFLVFLALTILGNERLVRLISVSACSRCRARNYWWGHARWFALFVDFIDFDGCDMLKEEKRYVYFFGDKIMEELGDFISAHNFGANLADDIAQWAPNDSTFECSVFPTVIMKPIKRRQLVGVCIETLKKVDPLAISIGKAFQWIRNSQKWPRKYLWTIGDLYRSWEPHGRARNKRAYMIHRTKSDAILPNLSARDINNQTLMRVKYTYDESSDLDDSNACFNDSQSASLNRASLYAKSAGPCVDARFAWFSDTTGWLRRSRTNIWDETSHNWKFVTAGITNLFRCPGVVWVLQYLAKDSNGKWITL